MLFYFIVFTILYNTCVTGHIELSVLLSLRASCSSSVFISHFIFEDKFECSVNCSVITDCNHNVSVCILFFIMF